MKKLFFKAVRFALIFFPLLVLGQQIKHLGVYDGIRSGAIRAFEKDTLGYMWIGTSQGLNRYSGFPTEDLELFGKYPAILAHRRGIGELPQIKKYYSRTFPANLPEFQAFRRVKIEYFI